MRERKESKEHKEMHAGRTEHGKNRTYPDRRTLPVQAIVHSGDGGVVGTARRPGHGRPKICYLGVDTED